MNALGVFFLIPFLFCLIVTCRFTYFLNMHYKQHNIMGDKLLLNFGAKFQR